MPKQPNEPSKSKPAANQPPAAPPPKLKPKPGAFQSASGLLGRAGSGGFTAPLTPPKIPTAADLPQEEGKHVSQKVQSGGGGAKQSTKAHVPRPQGRAVSGGSSGG